AAEKAQAPRKSARTASGAGKDQERRDIGEIDPAIARPGRKTPENTQPEDTEERQTPTADRVPDQREHHDIEQRVVDTVAQDRVVEKQRVREYVKGQDGNYLTN